MIDEWGNEVPEKPLESAKKAWQNYRGWILMAATVFIFAVIFFQLFFYFSTLKNGKNTATAKPSPVSIQLTPKEEKKLSGLATSSFFLETVDKQASLSSSLNSVDLFESGLAFPPVDQKVDFGGE
jgi:hypothetical protein